MTERELCFFLIEELLLAWDEGRELLDEVRALDIALQTEISRRTVGGTAPGYQNPAAWSNVAVAPPSSASDEKAPPLRRALT